jgi:hypothetical protein
MRMLAAAAAASIALILAGYSLQAPDPRIAAGPSVGAATAGADAASAISLLQRQEALEPHLFANECFMAVAYKRYQIPAAALDDADAAAGDPEPYFVDMVYVATDQRCPATEAGRTAENAPRLQAIQ